MDHTQTNSYPTPHHWPEPHSPSHTYSIGLSPSIPHSSFMAPATPTRGSARKPMTPQRSGEVSSVASDSEDEVIRVKGGATATTPTQRRKIVNAMEAPIPTIRANKRRETLQDRLSAAATNSPRRGSSIPTPSFTSSKTSSVVSSKAPSVASSVSSTSTSSTTKSTNDKVVVCMRIKPTQSSFASTAYDYTPTSLALSDSHPNVIRRGGKAAGREAFDTYQFDTLVQFPTRTPQLYADKVAPLVEKAMKGFNSTVFAYGQTGSGKSHTMSGTPSELGVIPCAIDGIFDAITADMDRAFLLRVSYIEIYNESLRDLLNFKKGPVADSERPVIRTAKGKIRVEPLVEEIVSCPEDVVHLLEKGNNNRRTGATDWNERSSRSHAVFTIVIESRPRETAGEPASEVRVSRLTLIDLAGSEKAVSDVERRGEGKHINRSLLALREVVHKLTEKKRSHVPYRDSKLTHLLENVLGGDSNICVICTMSAQEEHCAETLETLKFAGRCSQVVTKAQKNILQSSEQALIRAKDMEIADLKRQLEELASGRPMEDDPGLAELADELASMKARKDRLAQDLAHLNSQILTSELPPTSMSIIGATPRKRRARISDVSVHSSASQFLGLGTPRKSTTVDRRAVSTVLRTAEESDAETDDQEVLMDKVLQENQEVKSSDYGIAMSLRQTITEKEAELSRQGDLLEAARAEASELPALKSQLNNFKSTLETERDEHASKIRDLEAELESTRAEHAQAVTDKSEEIERLENQVLEYCKDREDVLVDDEERFDKVTKELSAAKKAHSEVVAELAKLRKEHAAVLARLEKERDVAIAEQGKVATQLAELKAAFDTEGAALRAERDKVAADLEALQKDHDNESTSLRAERDKVSTQLENFQRAALDRESEVVSTLRGDLVKERETKEKTLADLDKTRKRLQDVEESKGEALKEMSAQLAAILTERETAQLGQKQAATAREEAERANRAAVTEFQNREKQLAADIATVAAARDQLNTDAERAKAQVQLLQGQLMEKDAAYSTTVREIEALRAGADVAQSIRGELEAVRAQLIDTKSAHATLAAAHADVNAQADTLGARLADAKAATDAEAKRHSDTIAKLSASTKQVADLTARLEGEQKGQVELRSRAEAEVRDANDKRKAEVASIRSELEAMKDSMLSVTAALEAERAKKAEGEKAAQEIAALKAELDAAKAFAAEADKLKKEVATLAAASAEKDRKLDAAAKTATALKLENDKLAADLKAAQPSPRKRHTASASVPNAIPPTAANCPGHEAEIERLDKVVEVQKGIIEEQRLKITYWADELEKQREVVRLLTESASPATAVSPLPQLTFETVSTVSTSTNTSPTRSNVGSKRAHTNLPGKLGVYSPAPLPIPMHPGQAHNALRKARRVTIEHDMDRLQEASRVNRLKNAFDSPEKHRTNGTPTPSTPSRGPRESRVGTGIRGEGYHRG